MKRHSDEEMEKRGQRIEVPRDRKLDDGRGQPTPAPGGDSIKDEDYASNERPLPPDSPITKRLHEHPPKGRDQLEVGSAGDAARPSKEGIHNKTLPPRGRL